MAFELNQRDVNKLRRILLDLLDQSEADSALVCDQAGHVLAHENIKQQDPLLISALGAGVFAATRELARILGEDEFSTVLHQGLKRSILMAAATDEVLLVILFSGEARIGMVKLYTPAAATAIRSVFTEVFTRGNQVESEDREYILESAEGELFGATD